MRSNQIKFNGHQLVISAKKAHLIIRVVLILILTVCAMVPLIAAFFMVTNGEGLKLGVFVVFLLFWIPGLFLLRIFLWNNYGKEILCFQDDRVDYEADYGWFKDGKNSIGIQQLTLEFISQNNARSVGTLKMLSGEESIQTVLPVSLADYDEIDLYCERYKEKQND